RRLPENLPREPRHYQLSEAERVCRSCGQLRVDIGADRSEQLDYRPASLIAIEHVVHKYVCPCCSKQRGQAEGQQPSPDPESEAMPHQHPYSPPPTSPEPVPMPGLANTTPEQASAQPQPSDPGQRPPLPEPVSLLLDPGKVVITAPRPSPPIAKGLPGPGLLA